MVEFIVCFGSDDEKKENTRKKKISNSFRKQSDRKRQRRIASQDNEESPPISTNTQNLLPSFQNLIKSPDSFAEELDNGNLEYKLKLTGITSEKLEKRITQMKFRLREGNGECRYFIGVEDSGNPLGISEEEMRLSIETINKMTSSIGASINKVDYLKGKEGVIAQIAITSKSEDKQLIEIKIGLIGEENSGKSTLVGCLITDKKDNGKGLTRTNVFRHRHEINCGKTSSFTHQIIGFDKSGKKTNINNFGTIASWPNIVEKSVKIINFIDMGCSESSLNNSLKALSPNYLDYIILTISSVNGITNNTQLFLKIALSLGIPVIVIITKIDLINSEDIKSVLCNFKMVLAKEKSGKNPLVVKEKNDIVTFANNINEGILPVFLISNKNGTGLDYLNNFLSILPSMNEIDSINKITDNYKVNDLSKTEFDFLEVINQREIEGKNNMIVEGIVTSGIIIKGEKYKFGPFQSKERPYHYTKVLNIHCKKMEVHYATKGQFCSVEIETEIGQKEHFRTGMVLIGQNGEEISTRRFKAELWSMSFEKEIKLKKSYQPLVHIEHICQCVKLIWDNEESIVISPHKSVIIEMEFLYYPENIKRNSFLIIVDNDIQLYGHVKEI